MKRNRCVSFFFRRDRFNIFNTLPQTSDDVMRASSGKLSTEWFWNVLEML